MYFVEKGKSVYISPIITGCVYSKIEVVNKEECEARGIDVSRWGDLLEIRIPDTVEDGFEIYIRVKVYDDVYDEKILVISNQGFVVNLVK